ARARLAGTRRTLEAKDHFTVLVKEPGRAMELRSPRENERIYSFTLLDEDHVILGASPGLYLVDLRSGKVTRQYKGHSGIITAVALSRDGRYFLTGSADQTMCVFDPNRDEPLLSLFFAGNDWIAWTPEGYYAASANGERLMGWQINNGLEQV